MRLFGKEAASLVLREDARHGKYWHYPVEAFVEDLRKMGLTVERVEFKGQNQFSFYIGSRLCFFTYSPEHKQLAVPGDVARQVCDVLNVLLEDLPVVVYTRHFTGGLLYFEWVAEGFLEDKGENMLDKLRKSLLTDVPDLSGYKFFPYESTYKDTGAQEESLG